MILLHALYVLHDTSCLIDHNFSIPFLLPKFNLPQSDFGLAVEMLDSRLAGEEGLYNLTAMTGTPRYMSPGTSLILFVVLRERRKQTIAIFIGSEIL